MKGTPNSPSRIVIVGAGLGGLATAIALTQQGFNVQIYEKAKTFRPIGTGLGLSPNGLHCLEAIQTGIVQVLKQAGMEINALMIRRNTGELMQENPVQFYQNYGQPMLGIWWSTLQKVLASYLPEGTIHFDHHCVNFEEKEGHVNIFFSEQETVQADLLIGADGIKSKVRQCLYEDGEPRQVGSLSWRAIVQYSHDFFPANTLTLMRSSNPELMFINVLHIGHGNLYWGTRGRAKESSFSSSGEEIKTRILNYLSDWGKPLQNLVKATATDQILECPLFDIPPRSQWGKGRVILLGDAAHAMLPAMGQGANMAFEDAWTLSQCLKKVPNLEAALKEYQKQRVERATTLQNRSAIMEKSTYGDSQNSTQAETERLSQKMDESEFRDWLYGYKPTIE